MKNLLTAFRKLLEERSKRRRMHQLENCIPTWISYLSDYYGWTVPIIRSHTKHLQVIGKLVINAVNQRDLDILWGDTLVCHISIESVGLFDRHLSVVVSERHSDLEWLEELLKFYNQTLEEEEKEKAKAFLPLSELEGMIK